MKSMFKKLHRLQEKGKTHKERNKKKPRFQNNWCWLLENGQSLSPLAGEKHWQICFCARVVFLVRSDSPCATGAIQGNCLKVTSLRKMLAYYAYPYSSPSHYILLFSYSTLFLLFSLFLMLRVSFSLFVSVTIEIHKADNLKYASTNKCFKS